MATTVISNKKSSVGSPYYFYTLSISYSNRTATSVTVSYTLKAHLQYSTSYDATARMAYTVYVGGASKSGTLRASGESWSGTTVHTKTGSFTVTGLSNTTTSISTALRVTKDGGTSGTLNKTSGTSLTIPQNTSYSVTYNANGGSGAPTAQTKWNGVALTLSTTKPTATGYTFKNWNTKADGTGTSYSSGASYTTNAALALYARWTANSYTVTFNANGGTTPTASKSVTYKNTYGTLPTPTRTGHSFAGWFTTASGGSQVTTSTTVTTASAHTLYAHWNANTYSVEYNANNGSGTMSNSSHTYDVAKALTSNSFTRTGYTFKGWSTSSTATTATYANGASVKNLTSTNGATVNLYAVWQANTYAIKYNVNAPSGATATGSMSNSTHTYNTSKNLTTNAFVVNGYTFVKWNTKTDGTGTNYANGVSVKNLTSTNGATVNLYAQWALAYTTPKIKSFKVERSSNDDTKFIVNVKWENGKTNTGDVERITHLKIYYKEHSVQSYTTLVNISSLTTSNTTYTFDSSNSSNQISILQEGNYDFKLEITTNSMEVAGAPAISGTYTLLKSSFILKIPASVSDRYIYFGRPAVMIDGCSSSTIKPIANEQYSIGTSDSRWEDGYFRVCRIGSASYSAKTAVVACMWADGGSHDILRRETDGLTTHLGYNGSSTCQTSTEIHGYSASLNSHGGGIQLNGAVTASSTMSVASSLTVGAALNVGARMDIEGGIVPKTTNTYSLGTSDNRWSSAYIRAIGLGTPTYSAANGVIVTYFKDGSHNLLERNTDGLTTAVGYIGSSSCQTVTRVRGYDVRFQSSAGDLSIKSMYKKAGDTWTVTVDTGGYVTGSGLQYRWAVPTPLIVGTVSITKIQCRVRQNGTYIVGTSDVQTITSDITCVKQDGFCRVGFNLSSAPSGVTNNSPIAVYAIIDFKVT